MTNPTSNFGWQMPTPTDLVTDLPADFEVFGQAVDTTLADLKGGTTGQVLKKNTNTDMDFVWAADSAGMTNPMTTTGDTIYSSSGSTPARLGIGTNGQFLSVASGIPSWVAAPSGGANWSLLNSGGTTLTGSTTSVTGISAKDKIMVIIDTASSVDTFADIGVTFNSDTGSNYNGFGLRLSGLASYGPGIFIPVNYNGANIRVGQIGGNAGGTSSGYVLISGCNAAGVKVFNQAQGTSHASSDQQQSYISGGFYNSSSVISSVQVIVPSWTSFDNGKVFVYTSE
jgi:hypothetical protein